MERDKRFLAWWLVVLVLVGVGRAFVPTSLDWSVTSVYKDLAHIVWGGAVAAAVLRRDRDIGYVCVMLLLWEVLASVMHVGGLATP